MHRVQLIAALALAMFLSPALAAAEGGATLTAQLTDKDAKAQKGEATVVVVVTGVELIDPASVQEKPQAGQGHLHYQVDDGPVIATTATKLSFHELKPGTHTFKVMLATNNHQPAGPQSTMTITVPTKPLNAD